MIFSEKIQQCKPFKFVQHPIVHNKPSCASTGHLKQSLDSDKISVNKRCKLSALSSKHSPESSPDPLKIMEFGHKLGYYMILLYIVRESLIVLRKRTVHPFYAHNTGSFVTKRPSPKAGATSWLRLSLFSQFSEVHSAARFDTSSHCTDDSHRRILRSTFVSCALLVFW